METSSGLLPEGSRYLSPKNLLKRREPQVRVDHQSSYALGLIVEEECGIKIIHHDGGSMGFGTKFLFLPEAATGVILMANGGLGEPFLVGIQRRILELLFDGRERAEQDLLLGYDEDEKSRKKRLAGVELKPDRNWLKKIEGDYSNETLGRTSIRLQGDGAVFETPSIQFSLGRKVEGDGVVKAISTTPPWAGEIQLIQGEDKGQPTINLEMAQAKFVFKKVS